MLTKTEPLPLTRTPHRLLADPRRVIVAFEKTSGGGTTAREFTLRQRAAYLQVSVRGERTTYRYLSGDVDIWDPAKTRKEKKELLFDLAELKLKMVPKMVRDARKRLVHQAMEGMSDRGREILVLKEIQGLSFPEIAAMLGQPVGTVKSRSNRARIELARRVVALDPNYGTT